MKTFTDNKGRNWNIEINIATVKRLKGFNINLMDAIRGDLIKEVSDDPIYLADLIFYICKPQADELKISDEDFGSALAGDAIQNATDALLDELIDFFPPGKRQVLRKAWTRLQDAKAKAEEAASHYLDGPKVDAIIEKELKNIIG